METDEDGRSDRIPARSSLAAPPPGGGALPEGAYEPLGSSEEDSEGVGRLSGGRPRQGSLRGLSAMASDLICAWGLRSFFADDARVGGGGMIALDDAQLDRVALVRELGVGETGGSGGGGAYMSVVWCERVCCECGLVRAVHACGLVRARARYAERV